MGLYLITLFLIFIGLTKFFPYFFMYNTKFLVKNQNNSNPGSTDAHKWTCLNLGLILLIILISVSSLNPVIRIGLSLLIFLFFYIIIPFPFINICNLCMMAFSTNGPFLSTAEMRDSFPDSIILESQWDKIRWEYECFNKDYKTSCFHKNVPGFILDKADADNCWRTVFLKKQGRFEHNMTKHFPITQALLSHPSIHNAMFSVLDPEVSIPGHVGYFKGYLRYHLGISIPTDPEPPFITVGNETYKWREGEGVMFDDMYYHYVSNKAKQTRVVLFLDVLRPHLPLAVRYVRDVAAMYIENNPSLTLLVKNQHKQVTSKEENDN